MRSGPAGFAGYGAGALLAELSAVFLYRVSVTNNRGSMSGAISPAGSNLTVVDSDISSVRNCLLVMMPGTDRIRTCK